MQDAAGTHRLAVDVGGTFIDFALLDEHTGELVFDKQLATRERLVDEFMDGLARLPVAPHAVSRLFHGTTVAINAVLEERGARVGLVTTAGFRDVLAIGRGGRPEIYNWLYLPPEPLVPRYLRREVSERMAADGTVLLPLDLEALERESDALVADGVDAIAISFLHAYANGEHERAAADRISERHPNVAVTASSELASEWREFERTSTAVLNAYVQPLFARYVRDLEGRLDHAGYTRPLAVMQSNGGVLAAERAAAQPIRTLASGPTGGVIGAQAVAGELGHANVICMDVGGTSFDVALIEAGSVAERTETVVGGRPVLGPAVEITSIGAGGGSIAWIDHRGVIKVGPASAGASPGPACFGRGGEEPTTTDCQLLLGRLDPENFFGARLRLDPEAAARAVSRRIAEPLGLSVEDAADGVLAIAETNMTYAIRAVTIERGLDPREFVLFSYGGGGGLFAAALAQELEIPTVIVPRGPANFSAWGILTSDYREDAALTRVERLDAAAAGLAADLRTLAERASDGLRRYGFDDGGVELLYRADVRFAGQEHTVTVRLDRGWVEDGSALASGIRDRFVSMHRQLYGHGSPHQPVEIVTRRCRAIGPVRRPHYGEEREGTDAEPLRTRRVHFRERDGWLDTRVYDRERLARGAGLEGPAIVEEWATTIVVPPEWRASVDRLGNVVLERGGAS